MSRPSISREARDYAMTDRESNYCLSCWNDFTRLDGEDWNNLEKLMKRMRKVNPHFARVLARFLGSSSTGGQQGGVIRRYSGEAIICNETSKTFVSARACAAEEGIPYHRLVKHLKCATPEFIGGKSYGYVN